MDKEKKWVKNLIGEGNGNPLQYSYLENPMDGGAWRVTVHGDANSWTNHSVVCDSLQPHGL